MAALLEQGSYLSADGKTRVVYKKWTDDETPAHGVLQLAHGMAEYIARYDAFARYMAANGYVVYGSDHLGHGDTAKTPDELGYFAESGGYKLLTDDLKSLTDIARAENPSLPLALLGHSMGSFVARLYAATYSKAADALILSGTSGPNPAGSLGILAVNLLSLFKGERHRSKFINNLAFGAYNKKYGEVKTPFDWLSANEQNVREYIADERCGFVFTLSAFRDLFRLLGAISGAGWAAKLRKNLSVLLVSGEEDPVGAFGAGVRKVRDTLSAAGVSDVTLKLYDGMRHEILNETGKEHVWADILSWCDKRLKSE